MESCSNCEKIFEKRPGGKGYFRVSLENKLSSSGQVARTALSELTGSQFTPVSSKRKGQFLCASCWSNLNETIRYKNALSEFMGHTSASSYIGQKRKGEDVAISTKKPRFTSTPLKRAKAGGAKKMLFSKRAQRSTKWDTIVSAVRARKYARAFRNLIAATKSSRKQFLDVVASMVRKEMIQLLRPDTTFPLCNDVNMDTIANFNWDKTLTQMQDEAPTLLTVLQSAITSKSQNTLQRGTSKIVNLKPVLGTVIATLLHAKAPRKAAFIPTLFSVQFWRGNLKREVIKQMAHVGICIGYKATLSAVDNIASDFDMAAKRCKEKLEEQMASKDRFEVSTVMENDLEASMVLATSVQNIEDEVNVPSDIEDTILYSDGDADESELMADDWEESSIGADEMSAEEEESIESEEASEILAESNVGMEHGLESVIEPVGPMEVEEASSEDTDTDDIAEQEQPETLHPGFSLCWDNVGKKVITRHPTKDTANKYINMALGYMAVNRVPTTHLDWKFDEHLQHAADIPLPTFVPSESDFNCLRHRMGVIIGRIIVRHFSWFKDHFAECSLPHILHDHTTESSQKSVIINLGIFNENPSSTQGAIGIYESLQRYIPSINSVPLTSLVYGDGLSCERGNDAQKARANGLNPLERLEGLEPAAQEFHKEMLLLQDYYDEYFKGSSVRDRGALTQLKNVFNFRKVKADISDNFQHAWELMCLVTEGFVCLLIMELLKMEERSCRPASAPSAVEESGIEEKQHYFDGICTLVVGKVWHNLDTKTILSDDGSEPPVYCCGEDRDEDFIKCAEGDKCPNGEIFHYSCAGINPEEFPNEVWFCSEDCKKRSAYYIYCHCHEDLGPDEPMIACSAGQQCLGEEWYHCKHAGVDIEKVSEDEDWFCRKACERMVKKGKRKKKGEQKTAHPEDTCDYVYSYSRAMTWSGLNLICRRDAVREADGDAMLTHWKFDIVHFFRTRHPKYLILAHRLLASRNGWLPKKLQEELIWNRTVNYSGGIGRNLPMDLMNEILNRLFKDLLGAAKGQYTDNTLARCSHIVGPLGESLDRVFGTNVIENEIYRHRRKDINRDENVHHLIEMLSPEKLFSIISGRRHGAFPEFVHNENPKTPEKFSGKIKQLSKRLDRRRQVILNG